MEPTSLAAASSILVAALLAMLVLIFGIATLAMYLSNRSLRERLAEELGENERLRPFSVVADAAAEARRVLDQAKVDATRINDSARRESEQILHQARSDLGRAKDEANELRDQARAWAQERREKAEAVLAQASDNASKILVQARLQADAIAGDALRAMRDAERWAATEQAMRNVVEGYGDRYMEPPDGVLDGLAEDFAHKDAGRELQMARERSQVMVTEGRAATCDYAERHRRDTAIRFVTDAFSGKVDAILSQLRTTNVGTLRQKIRDAFALVNHNGQAFRNARITDEYLRARLEELDWAERVLVLRDREIEEQREIKARIREEERAQREFQRAQRQAAKDEAQLRKALEKARDLYGRARDEDREKYEAQLAELQAKLDEAEARSRRAVSMAQLTRSGHVYVISNLGSFGEDVFKIGLTRRLDPLDRVRELSDASVPFKFDVHAMIYSEDAPRLETALHHRFALQQVNKVNPRREFFRVTISDIRAVVEELGLEVHWTLAAEALEYRATQVLDGELVTNESVREAWLARQARWAAYLDRLAEEREAGADESWEDDLALLEPSAIDVPASLE